VGTCGNKVLSSNTNFYQVTLKSSWGIPLEELFSNSYLFPNSGRCYFKTDRDIYDHYGSVM
jgi:hypothetical protein